MKATEFHTTAQLFVGNDHYHSDREHAKFLDALSVLLRRDWAVRVLDAWRREGPNRYVTEGRASVELSSRGASGVRRIGGLYVLESPDAARHAAALAVFGSLDAGTRAKLGECP